MLQAVHDVQDIHRIHQKIAGVLRKYEEFSMRDKTAAYAYIRKLNKDIFELNKFFEKIYVTTADGLYDPPFISTAAPIRFDINECEQYIGDKVRALHDVAESLVSVRYIVEQGHICQ